MKSSGGKYLWAPSSDLILTPGLQSGVERLAEMPMLINGALPTTSLVFVGADASAAGWAERGGAGTLALQAGTAPSYDQPSPLASAGEVGAKFNLGGSFAAANNTLGNVDTQDSVIEIVCKISGISPGTYVKVAKTLGGTSTQGYIVYETFGGFFVFLLRDAAGDVATIQHLLPHAWYHFLCAADKSETLANGLFTYANTAALGKSGAAISDIGDLSTAVTPLRIGAASDGSSPDRDSIAYVAIHSRADWLVGGAGNATELAALSAIRYAALIGSKPTRTKYSILNPTAKGCTSAAHQTKLLGDGTSRLFLMGAGSPRFEKGVDGYGVAYVGAVIEGALTNRCLQSDDLNTTWTEDDATTAAGATVGPDGLAVAGHDTLTASADGGHAVQTFASITAVAHVYSHYVKRDGAADVTGKVQLVITSTGAVIATADFTAGENWSRPYVTGTATLNDTEIRLVIDTNGESIFARGAQLETGAYPSQLVKTTTAAVSKPADAQYYAITEGLDIGIGQGAVVVKFLTPKIKTVYLFTINDGGASNFIVIYSAGTALSAATRKSGGADGDVNSVGSVTDGLIHEALITWQTGRLRLCVDGVWGVDDTALDIPSGMNRLYVGSSAAPAFHTSQWRVIDIATHRKPVTWAGRWGY